MPLFNEADGIGETLVDLDSELHAAAVTATFLIQNDCSTDSSMLVLEKLQPTLHGRLLVETNLTNLRHGPTTRRSYHRALQEQCDAVVQLDSDGQFDAKEVSQMLTTFLNDNSIDLLIGARKQRTDMWYRLFVTFSVRLILFFRFGIFSPDPNSPIRIFRPNRLVSALKTLPENVFTPNILLTVYFHKSKLKIKYVPTNHRVRRGIGSEGTMWGASKNVMRPPRSLVKLCWAALGQLLVYSHRTQ